MKAREDLVPWSRVAILQGMRITLAHAEREVRHRPTTELRRRVKRLREKLINADDAYRAVLPWLANHDVPDLWRASLARLIEEADNSIAWQRRRTPLVSMEKRFELATDLEALEKLVQEWRSLLAPRPAAAA